MGEQRKREKGGEKGGAGRVGEGRKPGKIREEDREKEGRRR